MGIDDYYNRLNQKLFEAIPSGSFRILELGCASGRLGAHYKSLNPSTYWVGVEMSDEAADAAETRLDAVHRIDLDRQSLSKTAEEGPFDVVVMGDVLEHLSHPEAVLDALHEHTTTDAKILLSLPNMAHFSVLERLLSADIGYDDAGLLDKTHLRFYSVASAFKTCLDHGWLPELRDQYRQDPTASEFLYGLIHSSSSMGIPIRTALQNMGMYQMIIECIKAPSKPAGAPTDGLTVIVPVNREWQFAQNIARSPGLREINAEIIPVTGALSAAQAYAAGLEKTTQQNAWTVFAHQDVYFPAGAGIALVTELMNLERNGITSSVVGFAGLTTSATGVPTQCGLVTDRTHRLDFPAADDAVSMDEFAVALHRHSSLQIDHSLGWHTWATDLCLQARSGGSIHRARVIRIPLFHNSVFDGTLPDSYHQSSALLLDKYPALEQIDSLCGTMRRQSDASLPSASA